jgi:hypothetical protein
MAVTAHPETASLGDDFVAAAERALTLGQPDQVSDADLERVLTAAVRLYAAKTEADGPPAQPITPSNVTPTDVVVTVSEMIKAAGLNLWDVSMWFNRNEREGS